MVVAFEPDCPAHPFGHYLDQIKPKAGTAFFPRPSRRPGRTEEYPILEIVRNARSPVHHRDNHSGMGPSETQDDIRALGENLQAFDKRLVMTCGIGSDPPGP